MFSYQDSCNLVTFAPYSKYWRLRHTHYPDEPDMTAGTLTGFDAPVYVLHQLADYLQAMGDTPGDQIKPLVVDEYHFGFDVDQMGRQPMTIVQLKTTEHRYAAESVQEYNGAILFFDRKRMVDTLRRTGNGAGMDEAGVQSLADIFHQPRTVTCVSHG